MKDYFDKRIEELEKGCGKYNLRSEVCGVEYDGGLFLCSECFIRFDELKKAQENSNKDFLDWLVWLLWTRCPNGEWTQEAIKEKIEELREKAQEKLMYRNIPQCTKPQENLSPRLTSERKPKGDEENLLKAYEDGIKHGKEVSFRDHITSYNQGYAEGSRDMEKILDKFIAELRDYFLNAELPLNMRKIDELAEKFRGKK